MLEDEDEPLFLLAGWEGPPWRVRPGLVALSVMLGRSESTVVQVEGARVYAEGVVLRLVVRVRETGREARRRLFSSLELAHGRGRTDARLRPGGLRWGVELADGRRVTSLDESPWAGERPADADPGVWVPDHPVLEGLGRPSVWADSWSREFWLWPLPPEAHMQLVCAWTDRGLSETAVKISTAPLRHAATQAQPFWG